jgi:hypothetical protein
MTTAPDHAFRRQMRSGQPTTAMKRSLHRALIGRDCVASAGCRTPQEKVVDQMERVEKRMEQMEEKTEAIEQEMMKKLK